MGFILKLLRKIYLLLRFSSSYGINYVPGAWIESIQIVKGRSVVNGFESLTGQINQNISNLKHVNVYIGILK